MSILWRKINETFIIDDRYLFFVDGLKITLLLTFCSFLIGTAFGCILCAANRSKSNKLKKIVWAIRTVFMEMPTLVLLMLLVYIVFGQTALPVIGGVIVGLTLKAGSYLSVIFDTALDAVSKGEIEAARTLGMTRFQAFAYVALPQAVKKALPVYKNQFIATMQETSVVGYLAVVDLTRAASIVTSRTLDAFFGLITVAVIYFVIGGLVKLIFRALERSVSNAPLQKRQL